MARLRLAKNLWELRLQFEMGIKMKRKVLLGKSISAGCLGSLDFSIFQFSRFFVFQFSNLLFFVFKNLFSVRKIWLSKKRFTNFSRFFFCQIDRVIHIRITIVPGTQPFYSKSNATSPVNIAWTLKLSARTISNTKCKNVQLAMQCHSSSWLRSTGALTSSSWSRFPSFSSSSISSIGWPSSCKTVSKLSKLLNNACVCYTTFITNEC